MDFTELTKLAVNPGKAQKLGFMVLDGPYQMLRDGDGSLLPWDVFGAEGHWGAQQADFVHVPGLLQPVLDFVLTMKKRLHIDGRAFIFTPYSTDPTDVQSIQYKLCKYLKEQGFLYFPINYTSGGKAILGKVNKPNQILSTVWLAWHSEGHPVYYPDLSTMDYKYSNLLVGQP